MLSERKRAAPGAGSSRPCARAAAARWCGSPARATPSAPTSTAPPSACSGSSTSARAGPWTSKASGRSGSPSSSSSGFSATSATSTRSTPTAAGGARAPRRAVGRQPPARHRGIQGPAAVQAARRPRHPPSRARPGRGRWRAPMGSLDAIIAAGVDELAAVDGIGPGHRRQRGRVPGLAGQPRRDREAARRRRGPRGAPAGPPVRGGRRGTSPTRRRPARPRRHWPAGPSWSPGRSRASPARRRRRRSWPGAARRRAASPSGPGPWWSGASPGRRSCARPRSSASRSSTAAAFDSAARLRRAARVLAGRIGAVGRDLSAPSSPMPPAVAHRAPESANRPPTAALGVGSLDTGVCQPRPTPSGGSSRAGTASNPRSARARPRTSTRPGTSPCSGGWRSRSCTRRWPADTAFLRRFRSEAQSAAALAHPHVLAVFDWGEDESGPFLVLEYLGGGSLRDMLDDGRRLSISQAVSIGIQAADGLAYADGRGFVHRDVKPANLLFDTDGRLRVADFGLARAFAEAALTEPVGATVGTARYAAPEQALGQPGRRPGRRLRAGARALRGRDRRRPVHRRHHLRHAHGPGGRAPCPGTTRLGPLAEVLDAAATPDPDDRLDAAGLAGRLRALATTLPAPDPLPLALVVPGAAPRRRARGDRGARHDPARPARAPAPVRAGRRQGQPRGRRRRRAWTWPRPSAWPTPAPAPPDRLAGRARPALALGHRHRRPGAGAARRRGRLRGHPDQGVHAVARGGAGHRADRARGHDPARTPSTCRCRVVAAGARRPRCPPASSLRMIPAAGTSMKEGSTVGVVVSSAARHRWPCPASPASPVTARRSPRCSAAAGLKTTCGHQNSTSVTLGHGHRLESEGPGAPRVDGVGDRVLGPADRDHPVADSVRPAPGRRPRSRRWG